MSETIPNGWKVKLAEEIYNRLKVPRVYDRSAVSNRGTYPIIDQSEDGQIGFVDAKPEFEGSNIQPLVTFANHTCAVRRMRIPFGVIQNVFPLKGKKDTDINFIYHVLKGGVKPEGYKGHYPKLRETEFWIPPLPEQKKIASILTSVDEVIENTQKQIDKLQDLKKATMNELLTKGIGHTEFKDSELGRIPKSWADGYFEQFITLQRGTDLPAQDRKEGNIPIYGSNGIVGFHNDYVISGEGVITGRSGSIGDVYYNEERCWALNTTLYVKDFHGNLPRYIVYFLQFFDLKKFASGTGVPTLNRNDVHPQYVAFPQFEEQMEICKILNQLDETIFQKIEKLKRIKSLKKSLMQDLLTGKVRVKVN